MPPDGSTVVKLTVESGGQDFNYRRPAWSPTTNEILFTSNRAGNDDIFKMPAFSGAASATNLTSDNTGQDTEPNW